MGTHLHGGAVPPHEQVLHPFERPQLAEQCGHLPAGRPRCRVDFLPQQVQHGVDRVEALAKRPRGQVKARQLQRRDARFRAVLVRAHLFGRGRGFPPRDDGVSVRRLERVLPPAPTHTCTGTPRI